MTAKLIERLVLPTLLGLCVAVYLPVTQLGFVSDDPALILVNQPSIAQIPGFFFADLWAGTDTGYYRPLFVSTLAVDRALFGHDAWGFHLHSLMWHLCAGLGVHRVARAWAGERAALVAAAIFLLHPLQSEVVAWVSARNDSMAVALACASAAVLLPAQRTWAHTMLGGGLALGAMLSKENAGAAVVALLPALDIARRETPRRALDAARRYAPLGVAVGIWLAMRAGFGPSSLPGGGAHQALSTLANGPAIAAVYLQKLLIAYPLTDGHTVVYLPERLAEDATVLAVAAMLAGFAVKRGGRPAAVAVGLMAWLVLPAIVGIGTRQLLGERYAYLPMVAVALAAAATVSTWRSSLWVALLLPFWVWRIGDRVREWHDDVSLNAAAQRDLDTPYTQAWLADAFSRSGEPAAALPWYERALRGEPPICTLATQTLSAALAAGQPTEGVRLGRLAYDRGCAAVTGFRETWALTMLLDDQAPAAAKVMAPRPPCTAANALVLATLSSLAGDEAGVSECRTTVEDPAHFDEQVERLSARQTR